MLLLTAHHIVKVRNKKLGCNSLSLYLFIMYDSLCSIARMAIKKKATPGIVGNFYTGETLETRKDMRKKEILETQKGCWFSSGFQGMFGTLTGCASLWKCCASEERWQATVRKDLRDWNIAQWLAAQAWRPKFEHPIPHKKNLNQSRTEIGGSWGLL